jgi:hypothetical protein
MSRLSAHYLYKHGNLIQVVVQDAFEVGDGRGDMLIKWSGQYGHKPASTEYFHEALQAAVFSGDGLQAIAPQDVGLLADGLLIGIAKTITIKGMTDISALWWQVECRQDLMMKALCSPEGLRLYRIK